MLRNRRLTAVPNGPRVGQRFRNPLFHRPPGIRHARPQRRAAIHVLGTALVVYTITLLLATHLPERCLPRIPRVDKVMHFFAYAGLAILAGAAVVQRTSLSADPACQRRMMRIVLSLICLCALADELTQPLTGRSFQWSDWLADLAGAAVGMAVVSMVVAATRAGRGFLRWARSWP